MMEIALALLVAAPATTGYHVLDTIKIGGEGGWDYLALEPSSRRLFVSHATHVVVVDVDGQKVVGDIADTLGVHGITFAPDLGRGFTSNGRSSTATIFDLKTLAVIQQVKTGGNPDAILYDPHSRRVFTFNAASRDATVIDAASGTLAGSIPLGGKPEFAVSDEKGRVYVNIEDTSELVLLDPQALTVKARWRLAPCEEPTGLALDREHRRLFVGCSNSLMAVVDADSGAVVTTLPIGHGVDGIAYDAEKSLAFSSNGEGTLTIVQQESPKEFRVVDTVKTQPSARTLTLDPKTHRVFLSAAQLGPTPAPTPETPRPRPALVPDSFVLLVVGP
jgi:DNA-binding beta-propeller fold protein YncE